jgi:hypothetical protein
MTIKVNDILQKYSARNVALCTEEYPFAVINIRKNPNLIATLVKQAVMDFMGDYEIEEIIFDARSQELDVETKWGTKRTYQVREVCSYE